MTVLAFDLGGTRLKFGLVTESGEVLRADVRDTPSSEPLHALADAGASMGAADAVGIAVPGLVDDAVVVSLPGKLEGIVGVDLRAFARETFGVSDVVVLNDAIAYGIGEAGGSEGRTLVVTIGTGVGVAVIENDAPLGAGPLGGGLMGGFVPVSDAEDGPRDSIGRSDTIEALCNASRITPGFASVREGLDAFARGEPAAVKEVEAWRANLARALAALASAHAPARVVVGGGPVTDALLAGVEPAVNERLYGSYRVTLHAARLGDDAALVGVSRALRGGAR